ncbi:MAG TPA: RraA family protein [Rhodothermia bacterium]|nr:RraA family protein [Rhodothermia bacterium]
MQEKTHFLSHRLEKCYTGAVHDVLREAGHRHFGLPHEIRPLDPSFRLAGPAFTFSGRFEEGMDPHETVLRWTEMLTIAPAGCVLVCQPNNDTVAHMGELSAETLKLRGVKGYVVDGGCRDTEFILRIGFKVFCRYVTPMDIVGCWVPERYGEPVTVGAATIRTDDWIIGDRDGVIAIPGDVVESTLEETERIMHTESMVRKSILAGVDPKDAYLEYGKF